MADSDSEDLKRAIALSLSQDQPGPETSNPQVIYISDSDDDSNDKTNSNENMENSRKRRRISNKCTEIPPEAPDFLSSLNRRQMEAERLARSRISPPPSRRAGPIEPLPPKKPSDSYDMSELQYPRGALKKTWAFGHVRQDDIKIEEVFQKRDLKIAVLSAFEFDIQWLLTKIDTDKTNVMLVMQAKEAATRTQYRAETERMSFLKLCFPPMDGIVNCMHSKLQLLFYDDYLRVVVPSANLTNYDWGETGVMENSVFLIDLPKLTKENNDDKRTKTIFFDELVYFLQAMNMQPDIIRAVARFDFSGSEGLAFVHTIGGHHVGNAWKRTGYCGLGEAVRKLNLSTDELIDVDFVASSIGALTRDFLKTIYHAAQGQDPLIEYTERYNKPPKSRGSKTSNPTSTERKLAKILRDHFRAYFPTSKTVAASNGGTGAGGTICFNSGYWGRETFPKELFRDCISQRKGLLMHNKMLFARSPKPLGTTPREKPVQAWLYHGSANLSASAWGNLFKDSSTKTPKLSCRNWECGVLIPVSADRKPALEISGTSSEEVPDISIYRGIAPVPMNVPGELLQRIGTPWFLREREYW